MAGMQQTYSIKDLAREFAVTPRTVRFYEDQGLVSPGRRGTTRVYSDRDRTRMKLALRGRRLGLSVEECKEIIDMYDPSRPRNPRQLLRLREKIREHRAALLDKVRDIEATLNAMDGVERRCLEELLAAAA
jgi:DNA-binding transcriptional MerR regulator